MMDWATVRRKRVLVVDDDEVTRKITAALVRALGHEAELARDGIEGLAKLRLDIDLVLLDVVMPGVDGWQMLQRMQERHGSIPVIMFSGQVEERTAGEAEERGARGFVGKPFDPQELLSRAKALVPV